MTVPLVVIPNYTLQALSFEREYIFNLSRGEWPSSQSLLHADWTPGGGESFLLAIWTLTVQYMMMGDDELDKA